MIQPRVPDTGTAYDLGGAGDVAPLGHVTLEGNFRSVGPVNTGSAIGQLVLITTTGRVTLALQGPPQPGLSAPPHRFHYINKGNSSDLAGARADGAITLDLELPPGGSSAPPSIPRGAPFTLTFAPNP